MSNLEQCSQAPFSFTGPVGPMHGTVQCCYNAVNFSPENLHIEIESIKTMSMEDVSSRVLEKIKNI